MNNKYIQIIFGITFAVIFAMSGRLTAQTGWYPLQSGTENILKSVYFVSPNTGFMAGNGYQLRSADHQYILMISIQAIFAKELYLKLLMAA